MLFGPPNHNIGLLLVMVNGFFFFLIIDGVHGTLKQ